MNHFIETCFRAQPWNKGNLVGQKAPRRLKEIWVIHIRLQLGHSDRESALFNLAVDSKLRSCDLVKLRVRDVERSTSVPIAFSFAPSRWAIARLLSPWALSLSISRNRLPGIRRRPRRHPSGRPSPTILPAA